MKAVGNGTATITAKATDWSGKSASCRVIGTVLIDKMWFEISPYVINAGWSVNQGFWYTPDDAKSTAVTWSSGNKQVATVSSDGTVWSNYNWFGTATITAYAQDGSGCTASCTINVVGSSGGSSGGGSSGGENSNNGGNNGNGNDNPRDSGAVSYITMIASKAMIVGENSGIFATISPASSSSKITWSSSNTNIATVNSKGQITAKKEGTVKITAKAGGKSATCTVNVSVLPVYNEAGDYGGDQVEPLYAFMGDQLSKVKG